MNAPPKHSTALSIVAVAVLSLAMIGCQGITSTPVTTSTGSTSQTAAGQLSVTPASVTFTGAQAGVSQSQTATVTNTGSSTVVITEAPVTGDGFSASGLNLPMTLPAGQGAHFSVGFTPATSPNASGSVAITSNAANSMVAVPLTATGISFLPSKLAVTPGALSLGKVSVGGSGTATGTLTASSGSVTITSATSSNSSFALSGLSLPATIPEGKSASFTVSFRPQSSGATSAKLTFSSSASPPTTVADLSGTGVAATTQLSVGPTTLGLGNVTVGSTGTATGTLTAAGGNVTVSSAKSSNSEFALSGLSLPTVIDEGKSVPFTVSFHPSSGGAASATLTFDSNAKSSTTVENLSGTGTTTSAKLAVSPTTLNLGSVAVGADGTAQGTLTASGADVTINSASSSNSHFALSGITLPAKIPAGKSATFTVTFNPQATGSASGTLTFTSNAVPSSTVDDLIGTGTSDPQHTVSLSWNPSSSSNIVGYNVYRSTYVTSCGAYSKLNSALNTSTSYGDSSVVDGQKYCYVTTAVNSKKEESAYSAVVEATIPAP